MIEEISKFSSETKKVDASRETYDVPESPNII